MRTAATAVARPSLVYLPFRAMAETSRLILAYGGKLNDFSDLAVWGNEFHLRKSRGDFPWGKTPVLHIGDGRTVVAQSGAIARYCGRLVGAYGVQDHVACALDDSVFELGQELCTINPLVNCFTGAQFTHVRQHYFQDIMPGALAQLEHNLVQSLESQNNRGLFFAGASPGIGDFNVCFNG